MYAENSMVSFQNLPCMTRTVELDIFFYWECNAEQFKKNRTNRNKSLMADSSIQSDDKGLLAQSLGHRTVRWTNLERNVKKPEENSFAFWVEMSKQFLGTKGLYFVCFIFGVMC